MVVLPSEDCMKDDFTQGTGPPDGPEENYGPRKGLSLFWCVWLAVAAIICLVLFGLVFPMRSKSERVIAYCAQDQEYAEAIFRDFQKATGIIVRPVYDNEAVKTVGLANRLVAERAHPRCDVFWGNEEMRTRQLAARAWSAASWASSPTTLRWHPHLAPCST